MTTTTIIIILTIIRYGSKISYLSLFVEFFFNFIIAIEESLVIFVITSKWNNNDNFIVIEINLEQSYDTIIP